MHFNDFRFERKSFTTYCASIIAYLKLQNTNLVFRGKLYNRNPVCFIFSIFRIRNAYYKITKFKYLLIDDSYLLRRSTFYWFLLNNYCFLLQLCDRRDMSLYYLATNWNAFLYICQSKSGLKKFNSRTRSNYPWANYAVVINLKTVQQLYIFIISVM